MVQRRRIGLDEERMKERWHKVQWPGMVRERRKDEEVRGIINTVLDSDIKWKHVITLFQTSVKNCWSVANHRPVSKTSKII